jgi:hypothetical protein
VDIATTWVRLCWVVCVYVFGTMVAYPPFIGKTMGRRLTREQQNHCCHDCQLLGRREMFLSVVDATHCRIIGRNRHTKPLHLRTPPQKSNPLVLNYSLFSYYKFSRFCRALTYSPSVQKNVIVQILRQIIKEVKWPRLPLFICHIRC